MSEQGEIGNIPTSHLEREMKSWFPEMRYRIQVTNDSDERKPRTAYRVASDHDEDENNRYIKITDTLAEAFTYTISFLSPWQPRKVNIMNLIL